MPRALSTPKRRRVQGLPFALALKSPSQARRLAYALLMVALADADALLVLRPEIALGVLLVAHPGALDRKLHGAATARCASYAVALLGARARRIAPHAVRNVAAALYLEARRRGRESVVLFRDDDDGRPEKCLYDAGAHSS